MSEYLFGSRSEWSRKVSERGVGWRRPATFKRSQPAAYLFNHSPCTRYIACHILLAYRPKTLNANKRRAKNNKQTKQNKSYNLWEQHRSNSRFYLLLRRSNKLKMGYRLLLLILTGLIVVYQVNSIDPGIRYEDDAVIIEGKNIFIFNWSISIT